jgi:hypothetical protein
MISLFDNQRQPYERPTVTPAGPDPYRLTAPLDDQPGRGEPRQPTTGDRLGKAKAELVCDTCEGTGWHPPGDRKGMACWDCSGDGKVGLDASLSAWLVTEVERLRVEVNQLDHAIAGEDRGWQPPYPEAWTR